MKAYQIEVACTGIDGRQCIGIFQVGDEVTHDSHVHVTPEQVDLLIEWLKKAKDECNG